MADWSNYLGQFTTEEQAYAMLLETKTAEKQVFDYRHLVGLSKENLIEKVQLISDTTADANENIKVQFFTYVKSKAIATGDDATDWITFVSSFPINLQTAIQEIVNYETEEIQEEVDTLSFSEFSNKTAAELATRYTESAFIDNPAIYFKTLIAEYFIAQADILLDPWQALIASYEQDSYEQNAVAYFIEWYKQTETTNSFEDFIALDITGIESKLKESFLSPYTTDTGELVPSYATEINQYFWTKVINFISENESSFDSEELETELLATLRSNYAAGVEEQISFLKEKGFISQFTDLSTFTLPELYTSITVNTTDQSADVTYEGGSYTKRRSFSLGSLTGQEGKMITIRPTFSTGFVAPKVGVIITDASGDTEAAALVEAINEQQANYESPLYAAINETNANKVDIFHNGEINGVEKGDEATDSPLSVYPFFFYDLLPAASEYANNLANVLYTDALLSKDAGFTTYEKTIRLLQLDSDEDDTNDLPFTSRQVRVSTVNKTVEPELVTVLGDYSPNEQGYIKVSYTCALSDPDSVTLRFELFDQENQDLPEPTQEGDFLDADFATEGVLHDYDGDGDTEEQADFD